MTTFSWSDTARAAFATCFACFPQIQSRSDEEDQQQQQRQQQRQQNRHENRDELESLLRSAEYSDGEMDTDALSLHSDVGTGSSNPRRNLRQKQKRRRAKRKHNKGTIQLCGFDLFGKALRGHQGDDRSDEDGGGDNEEDSEEFERRRIARLSSSTLDSDPVPVEDDVIARLSAGGGRAARDLESVQQRTDPQTPEEEASAAAARKAARKERRRQRKLSSALLNADGGDEFEGFQGSGGDSVPLPAGHGVPSSSSLSPSSSGFPLQGEFEFGAFQEARSPLLSARNGTFREAGAGAGAGDDFVRVSRNDAGDDDDDGADKLEHADFDAVAYVGRRNSIASRSGSGSGSLSHTSVSRSEDARFHQNQQAQLRHLRPPPPSIGTSMLTSPHDYSRTDSLPSPSPSEPRLRTGKKSRRSTTSGHSDYGDARQTRRSRRSTTAGTTTSVTSASTTESGSGSGSGTLTSSSSQPHSPPESTSLSIQGVKVAQPDSTTPGLRLSQHNPAFEGVPEDDDEFSTADGDSALPSPAGPGPTLKSPTDMSGFPSPGLGITGSTINRFPSAGLGVRRNSSAMAGSGVFLARTGDDD